MYQCIEQVPNKDVSALHQCTRKAKFGNYCGIHWKLHKNEITADPNTIVRAYKIEGNTRIEL